MQIESADLVISLVSLFFLDWTLDVRLCLSLMGFALLNPSYALCLSLNVRHFF